MSTARKSLLRVHFTKPASDETLAKQVLESLQRIRNIDHEIIDSVADQNTPGTAHLDSTANFTATLSTLQTALGQLRRRREAEALSRAAEHCTEPKRNGGLGLSRSAALDAAATAQVLFHVEAWLDSLNAAERARKLPPALTQKPAGRRPMTLSQKIFAHHAIGHGDAAELKVGDVVRVAVDWIIASEISWVGMKKNLDASGAEYRLWRNDRFWLAGDHVVDPQNYDTDLSKSLIKASEAAAKEFKLTDYKGMNYTIIHTEFVRSRAEPGMLALGSDSHTCSSGAVGCLAIGLGAAEVAMALVTGETWFKVPEAINVRFVGEPSPGTGGKDVILYILGELRRNTVAADRIVEFSGPGLKHLSVDARFAISNMCTEFGAITGVFVPDETTRTYISARKQMNRKSSQLYFAPDEGAPYVETFDIDLSKVRSFFAIYPNPDDVVPVASKAGMKLDGCFIGACTTALEDLILAAMVLDVGLNKKGLKPASNGKRHVVPGSVPVTNRLEELGLLDLFTKAGFIIGVPGCSFCVGMGSDQAKEGEVWLSSQNRNFQNRMGKGSFGNLASAATVAASSFSMQVTDPAELLQEVDMKLFDTYRGHSSSSTETQTEPAVRYVEPALKVVTTTQNQKTEPPRLEQSIIKSKVVRLGEYIDTDALAPAERIIRIHDPYELGSYCLEHTHPDFVGKVRTLGQRIVVAGKAFGVGSSRENAVTALQGAGVQAVIAPSFAFIYSRNQPNLGLLGIVIDEVSGFYDVAIEGAEVEIDVLGRVVKVAGREFGFPLTDMEVSLLANKGINNAYKMFGEAVFGRLCGVVEDEEKYTKGRQEDHGISDEVEELSW